MGKATKHKPFKKEAAKVYGGNLKHFIKTICSFEEEAGPPTPPRMKSKGRGRPRENLLQTLFKVNLCL